MAGYSTDAGSANNVQAGGSGYEDDAEGIAGIYQQIVGRNKKAQGPNAAAYNKQTDTAQGNANAYGDRGLNYTQDAPTIANQYQDESRSNIGGNVGDQRYLASHLRDITEGKDVTGAQAQIQQGTDAGIAAQMNVARSAKGGGAAQSGAVRSAQQQGAVQQAGVASAAGQLQAQLAGQAAGQAAGVYGNIGSQIGQQYGLEQGSAMHQADLQSTNQGQIDQTRLGYGALGNNAQAGSLNALNGYTQGTLSAQGLQPGIDAQNNGGKLIGTAASAAGAMLMSDETLKSGIESEGGGGGDDGSHPLTYDEQKQQDEKEDKKTKKIAGILGGIGESFSEKSPQVGGGPVGGPGYTSDVRTKNVDAGGASRVDAFLDGIHPLSYHYKQAANEPRSQATGGRYLGISAQDLEAVPEVGKQMVSDGPRGKQVEIGPSLSAALAGVARLNERLKAVEGAKGVTSDMAAKTDVATEGATPYVDPRAKAWDEGHNEALNKVQQYRQMTPEQLKELGDKGNRLANAVRGAKADAWDEAHGRNQSMTPSLIRQPTSFTREHPSTVDTALSPQDETAFKAWKQQYAPNDSGGDYDLRGAYQAGIKPDPQSGHWPDTFKKPNHPTFSDESQYAKQGRPGHWNGETFTPAEPTLASLYSPQSGGQR